ncbi:Protein FAR1-RELATED SEQUENCE 11 [Rhynchospora pubera]|uniref:Protein FAR1-RELATED SEQUENCE n=1 Tax=Rhynchospora pubera TaxID=906938 RepID=A0AAV8EI18_9POAL|nr:Protein FAR1-RELATED SEQUENCE 11 [Rhynchospora pubera]KAJ4780898.1 Protein FAR1-RELATED SEQUENCE 11 [Rhynchospora pubera]
MTRASSRNIGSLTQRRKCPCGDENCYLRVDGNEEENNQSNNNSNTPTTSSVPLGSDQLQAAQVTTSFDFTVSTEIRPPYVGQAFQTAEEAQEHYTRFAKVNGFAIRTERSKGNSNHPLGVYKRELVCHRAGAYRPRKMVEQKRQRNKKSNRCKCEAGMIIKKNVSKGISRWIVVQFSNEHNHEMLDSDEVRQLPAYRNISSIDRERALVLSKAGCTVNLIMRSLEMEKGLRPGQLTFTERDLRNFLQVSKSINIENEGTELLNACKEMKERYSDFKFEFSVNSDGTLENICWTYPDCVRAYAIFGDAVVFDTTYRLYAYDRPVGVWFGMDNYGNAICFGCSLLQDEKPSSYQWALQSFVCLMDGKYPQTLLTDLDMSLKEAVMNKLPSTKHAFAPWYITSKIQSWFSPSLSPLFEKLVSEFNRVRNLSCLEEFSDQWSKMVSEFRLASDRHVNLLAYNRENWTLPFLRGCFFGCLIGGVDFPALIKGFFKGLLSSQTRLRDFVEQVRVAIELQNQAGEESTMRQNYQNMSTRTCMPMEEHAASILTPYAFNLFRQELIPSTQFAVYETHKEAYLVRHRLQPAGGQVVMCVGSDLQCSCKEFESSGILCRHALRVLSLKNCFTLPDKYLLMRWRRESSLFPKSTGYKYRSRALRSLVSIILQEASVNKERFNYAQWHMSKLLSHVREMPTLDDTGSDAGPISSVEEMVDITLPKPRGRPKKDKLVSTSTIATEESEALEENMASTHDLAGPETHQALWDTHDLFGTQDLA